MKASEAKKLLAELDRAEECFDAVDAIRAALREAENRPPGWLDRWLREQRKAARAKESVNHKRSIVNHNVK